MEESQIKHPVRHIINEQIDYYRARAPEYEDWFYRRGRYDHGERWNELWRAEVAALEREVAGLPRCETVLELACGTGIWTGRLCSIGRHVVAYDASPEALEINRRRGAPAEYRQADLFAWEPDAEYDLVFFAFWLSHVPPPELDGFLEKVGRAVRPGGRVFAIDSLPDEHSSAVDQGPKRPERSFEKRRLGDGREFTVVKVYYRPPDLVSAFERHGLRIDVRSTGRFFWFAQGVKGSAA